MHHRTFACQCANVKIRGQALPPKAIPNIPKTETRFLSQCNSLRIVNPKSIEVKNFAHVAGSALSSCSCDLFCTNCNAHFRVFAGRGIFYVGRMGEDADRAAASNKLPNMLGALVTHATSARRSVGAVPQPKAVARTFSDEDVTDGETQRSRENLQQICEDADFDLMFSNQEDLIVGSYKQHMEIPVDVTLGQFCEFAPRTYFK